MTQTTPNNPIHRIDGTRPVLVGFCVILFLVLVGAVTVNVEAEDASRTVAHEAVEELHILDTAGVASFEVAAIESPVSNHGGELLHGSSADRARNEVTPRPAPEAEPSIAHPRVMWMEVTAYCPCTHCCGPNAQGITASGKPVSYNNGAFVAADTRILPFGTKLSIPGYTGGATVEVIDRGGAIKGNKLDVFYPTHQQAREWGRRWVAVTVNQ